ncbi:MAG: TonB-dependent receptor [Verrucomicrobia bacterium]|nr:TonB-dependent receptor [Verrucomicrobiota bacterium]
MKPTICRLPDLARLSRIFLLVGTATASIQLIASSSLAAQNSAGAATDTAKRATATGTVAGRVKNVVTGQYLSSVRVSIKDTDLVAFTDQSGEYRIANVPAGQVAIEVLYTGLDLQQATLAVTAGETTQHDVNLTNRRLYGDPAEIVKLDPFVTSSARETDAGAIAVNEQRFAPNIMNVVAPDAYGDIIGGNVGDFLKYLPGVLSADPGSQPEPTQISLRGFAADFTGFSVDGAMIANANSAGNGRAFELNQSSIANVARVEITKVPTPSDPASSMAGSINLVSKSAFERSRAELRYRVSLTSNSEDFSLKPTPDQFERKSYKIFPSFDFDYTLPLRKNFGIVVTGLHSKIYYPNDTSIRTFATSGVGTAATLATPYMNSQDNREISNFSTRDSLSMKADWRVTPNSVLSFGVQNTYFLNDIGYFGLVQNTGTTGTPTIAGGTAFSYDPTFTVGATGRGSMVQSGTFRRTRAAALAGNLNYRYNNGSWKVDGGLGQSFSRNWWRDGSDGFFAAMAVASVVPVRVTFRDIRAVGAGEIQVFDNSNRPVDIYDGKSYQLNTATVAPRDVRDEVRSARLSVAKTLDFMPFPSSLKLGGLTQEQNRDSVRRGAVYTYTPRDGNRSIDPFLSQVYGAQTLFFRHDNRAVPWASYTRAWEAFQKDPSLFPKTPAQVVQTARDYITNSQHIEETISAAYVQAEGRLLRNHLRVLTGVRFEKTTDLGFGPLVDASAVFARNPNGTFVRDAAGNRVRRPEAGAAGSLEELALTSKERGARAERSYGGYYPSLHFTYSIRENLLARLAYAKSFGRPNFAHIIPTVNETQNLDPSADIDVIPGTITLANTGLKPWSAGNYDFSLEYYSDGGGLFTVGVFKKEIRDFFGSVTKIATQADLDLLDLDERYLNWRITSQFNAGSASVTGGEFSITQSLNAVGSWGRYFSVFLNGTKLRLEGDQAVNFPGFIPESVNWGFSFRKSPINVSARWNYRGKFRTATVVPALGPTGRQYTKAPHPRLDLNADYTFSRRVLAYLSVKNATNVTANALRYADETPDYAKPGQVTNTGVIFEVGVKGSF